MSQRDVARIAGVPPSTIDRIEAGTSDPRTGTLTKILAAIGFELAVCIGGQRVQIDVERDALTDFGGRHFPPHWNLERVHPNSSWWGWARKHPKVSAVPLTYSYWRRWGRDGDPGESGLAYLWQDAT